MSRQFYEIGRDFAGSEDPGTLVVHAGRDEALPSQDREDTDRVRYISSRCEWGSLFLAPPRGGFGQAWSQSFGYLPFPESSHANLLLGGCKSLGGSFVPASSLSPIPLFSSFPCQKIDT